MTPGVMIGVNGTVDPELSGLVREVDVTENRNQPTSYTLRFDVAIAGGDLPVLRDERLDVDSELSVLVPLKTERVCLVKGPVRGQRIHLVHGGEGSRLEARGSDSSIRMDRETPEDAIPWGDTRDHEVAHAILSNYNYTPSVEPTDALHETDQHALSQRSTDLQFVNQLARRNGFDFWVRSDPRGQETANFRTPPLEENAAASLSINGSPPSLQSLDIDWDAERPTSVVGDQRRLNLDQGMEGPVRDTLHPPLGRETLQDITGDVRSVHLSPPLDDAGDWQARKRAALNESNWFIRARGSTTLRNLGTVLRPYMTVDLQGAGRRHSGRYFVAGVSHTIDATDHRMNLTLLRNSWGT